MSDNDSTELIDNDTLKNTHNLYAKPDLKEDETSLKEDNNISEIESEIEKDNNSRKDMSLTIIIFCVFSSLFTATYYYTVTWLVIRLNLIGYIDSQFSILTIISGVGFSLYLSILCVNKLKDKGQL